MKKRSGLFKVFFGLVVALILVSGANQLLTEYRDHQDGCKPTGEQRMVNSVMNAPEGGLTGLMVEDKFVCKNGRVTWKAQYN